MKKQIIKNKKKAFFSDKPVLYIVFKSILAFVIIGSIVFYSDNKGYFNPDESNNHTKRKWDSFYEFSEKDSVDILLMGNSHLYTGVNPKNLSSIFGVNAFILASPGTNIADTYFGLKEALIKTKPKLVIIETYGIGDLNPFEIKGGELSDQFKSFYARKDFFTKLISTPSLFKSDNYFYAWSNTLRNHDFIFNDTAQLTRNKKIMTEEPIKSNKLYLGRYVRFYKGIEEDVLKQYDTLGSPVKGGEYKCSRYAESYVDKIVSLCKENNIELMFLTLPMYYKHIDNYESWENELGKILNKYPNKWLNMQMPYDTTSFSTICFENTYKENQHMTYNGSLIATYKLADFIKRSLTVSLPNRKTEIKWWNNFYGEEGYFENNPVSSTDNVNKLLCQNFKTNNVTIEEVSVIKLEKGNNKMIIAKVVKGDRDLSNCKLRLAISLVQNNQLQATEVDLVYDKMHKLSDKYIFKTFIIPIDVKEVKAGAIICE